MSSIEFVQSSKSKTILVVDGYEYYKKREINLTTAWTCAHYHTLTCRTSANVSGEQLISIRGNHNHDICLRKFEARKVSKKIKELSELSTPAVSLASAFLEVMEEYATQMALPSKASLFKVSQRVRQKMDLIHYKCGRRLAFWHPCVLFGLASMSVENAAQFEEGCCNPKVSLFAVNSRYGVFEERKLPRTGGEGKKRK